MQYKDIDQETKKELETALSNYSESYGYDVLRLVVNRFVRVNAERARLEKEIAEREQELEALKTKREK